MIDLLFTILVASYLVSIVGGLLLAPRKGVPMGWTLLATWIGGPIGLFYLLSLPDVD